MAPPTSTSPGRESPRGLLDQLLHEQQLLTPVAEFARQHERGEFDDATARHRKLLPVTPLVAGEQYAFEVELDKCSGCKACVTACHSLNGLDEDETWRDVGLLISPPTKPWQNIPAIQQTVTTACHHCVEPACLEGCPVLAYEKDPLTGIVRHLDDQCIGCQYCVLKCPYDVPKYNSRLGIVRKCDMCANRLAVSEAPACAQACPNEAIRITKVSKSEVTIQFRERSENFLSGALAGDYTLPTTRYVSATSSRESAPDLSSITPDRAAALSRDAATGRLVAADAAALRAQPAHWPLVFMLVISQAAVGATCAAAFMRANFTLLLLALALGVSSVVSSVFHLGRPLGAWRFFLGLKRSWLSREILAFSLFIPLLAAALVCSADLQSAVSQVFNLHPFDFSKALQICMTSRLQVGDTADWKSALRFSAALIGLLGVFCSMMIYHDTRRVLWNWRRSAALFFGTTALLGLSAWFALNSANAMALAALVLAAVAKLAVEISVLRHVAARDLTPLKRSALLITGRFQHTIFARMLSISIGGIGLPLLLHVGAFASNSTSIAWLAFASVLAGELAERVLFFRTVVAPKMPGGLPA